MEKYKNSSWSASMAESTMVGTEKKIYKLAFLSF